MVEFTKEQRFLYLFCFLLIFSISLSLKGQDVAVTNRRDSLTSPGSVAPARQVLIYHGTSDASAAAVVGLDMFIVADDENNVLRVYKTNRGGLPLFSYDLTDFLDIEPEYPEADIEGATMIGNRIYWITSHGRNKDGEIRPNRYRFFATSIDLKNGNISVRPVGIPCKTLLHKLLETDSSVQSILVKATRLDDVDLKKRRLKTLAPKRQGLNIEALCASADGRMLYIGFRNPRPSKGLINRTARALVLQLKNPDAVVERADTPAFGPPMLWNLAGRGIRSMEYSDFHKVYFIIAGPHDETSDFALYRWSGEEDTQPTLVHKLDSYENNLTPEALLAFKNSPGLFLLSDDGSLPVQISDRSDCMEGELNKDGTCPNKFLTDPAKKTFRAIWLYP